MKNNRGLRFNCFSPPVMVATAVIELSLMMYTLWKYRSKPIGRVAALLLYCLAVFQVAEYNVCGGMGVNAESWSRLGFMIIALLPAIGIHLAMVIAKVDWRWMRYVVYANALLWIGLFGFSEKMFENHSCGGNYIIFHVKPHYGAWYFVFYYFWLFVGIGLSLYLASRSKQRQKRSLQLLVLGYLTFMLPTAFVNTVNPQSMEGLPSILCGFAVFFAMILVFGILPNELRSTKKKITKR